MIAFIASSALGILGLVAVVVYGKRRAPGTPLTWGEAMVAAAFAMFMFFWWYGVVPHLWLTWADNELKWRPDRQLWGPKLPGIGNLFRPNADGGHFPVTLNWLHIRDLLAVGIYGVAVGMQIGAWSWWNDREKKAAARAAELPTSSFGRPLVKRG
jgi:hypothetical protein